MRRFLLLTHEYPPDIGGLATSVRCIAYALQGLGHTPFICCIRGGTSAIENIQVEDGIKIHRVTYKSGIGNITLPYRHTRELHSRLSWLLNETKPDVIVSRWTNYSIALSRYHAQIPPFIHIPPSAHHFSFKGGRMGIKGAHKNPELFLKLLLWRYAEFASIQWERKVVEKCKKTVVFSRNVKQQFNYLYPDLNYKIQVIYPGADTDRFRQPYVQKVSEINICKQWNIPAGRRLFLYVGRLSPDKHLDLLLDGFNYLKQNNNEVYDRSHLLLVGQGPHEANLRQKSIALNLQSHVTFCGPQSEQLPQIYSAAWALIMPSLVESFGHVMIEAALCETPTIAFLPDGKSVLTASDDIIIDGVSGILVSPAKPDALAQGWRTASLWSSDTRKAMGNNARTHVSKMFQWEKFVQQLVL